MVDGSIWGAEVAGSSPVSPTIAYISPGLEMI